MALLSGMLPPFSLSFLLSQFVISVSINDLSCPGSSTIVLTERRLSQLDCGAPPSELAAAI